jgi:hypothetical protein
MMAYEPVGIEKDMLAVLRECLTLEMLGVRNGGRGVRWLLYVDSSKCSEDLVSFRNT